MPEPANPSTQLLSIVASLVLVGVVASSFLFTEHLQHTLGVLPYLLFLVPCLFMHRFMHGGHGGHDAHREGASSLRDPAKSEDRNHTPGQERRA